MEEGQHPSVSIKLWTSPEKHLISKDDQTGASVLMMLCGRKEADADFPCNTWECLISEDKLQAYKRIIPNSIRLLDKLSLLDKQKKFRNKRLKHKRAFREAIRYERCYKKSYLEKGVFTAESMVKHQKFVAFIPLVERKETNAPTQETQ